MRERNATSATEIAVGPGQDDGLNLSDALAAAIAAMGSDVGGDPAFREAQGKADVLVGALPFYRKYQGYSAIVMKIGGSLMDSPAAVQNLCVDASFMEGLMWRPVIVNGGGKAITRALEAARIETSFDSLGNRKTGLDAIEIVDDTLFEITQDLAARIRAQGGKAEAFRGSQVFRCERKSGYADDNYVGEILRADCSAVVECLNEGAVPVISPTALGSDGQLYNCNADHAATEVAKALNGAPFAARAGAKALEGYPARLLFLTDQPGILADINDPKSLYTDLSLAQARALIAQGVIGVKMLPKLEGVFAALDNGIKEVSFLDGRKRHAALLELMTPRGIGTMFRP